MSDDKFILSQYMAMLGTAINSPKLKELHFRDGACWITKETFIWMHECREKLMITIKPPDSFEEFFRYSFDITHDTICIHKAYDPKGIDLPRISTEEEYFQQSTIHDLSIFTLDFFEQCSVLFDKTWNQLAWYK